MKMWTKHLKSDGEFREEVGTGVRVIRHLIISILLLSLIPLGCASKFSAKKDAELDALISAFVEYNKDMEKKRAERVGKGIKRLTVEKRGKNAFVSADLENAVIQEVVNRLFQKSGKSYLFDDVAPHGTVTTRFDHLPLLKALNLILEPILLSAEADGDMIVIGSGVDEDAAEGAHIYEEISLRNLGMDDAKALLNGLYPVSQMTSARVLDFGHAPGSTTIYLKGPENEVSEALRVLMKMDAEVRHVVIEVLVVEFDAGTLDELGANIQNLQTGKYTDINLMYGATGISFTKPAPPLDHLTSFTGIVEMMISNHEARLISRPYLATLSGKRAEISITSDRYVIVDEGNNSTATQPIEAGVKLEIKPTVLPGGNLRMELLVEDSQFSAVTLANVSSEVNKNGAETVMHVEDGQTIMIGGLILDRRAWGNTGFPFLRNIPILNLLFAKQSEEVHKKEVAIYVTPHIWEPHMKTPLINPDALTIKEGESWIDKMK